MDVQLLKEGTNMTKIFYIWDYYLNHLPEPAAKPEAKIIPFPGKALEPFEEWAQIEGFILLGYRQLHPGLRTRNYLAYYLPETGPRFIRTWYLYEDEVTGEIELGSWGRIRGRFWPDKASYTYTDAVHLAPPNPDRRAEYLEKRKAEEEQHERRITQTM